MQIKINEVTIKIVRGDITKYATDAIVNAANSSLLGGGGVDGAIHRAGGPAILEECRKIRDRQGGCDTGEAVVTTAGKLPAKFVVHTVGPVYQNGNKSEAELLKRCYVNSIQAAVDVSARRISFPNISTGIYGYPKKEAAEIAVTAVKEVIQAYSADSGETFLEEVAFVCYDEENERLYRQLLEKKDR
ncbi:macro domain-containing protein [Saccharibacillus endophyticus]|uniref:Macro domain-containing protein n=1 Tax=Saccharibacillus endophyticus TaxID=2060666 RepID=A0ABQ2A546_9BACL|nr:O-acetyl-ADP-ribose deacetylase [Saccharibacillus endophyticus]GGH84216.1 macro domain-containing protein [Saccharibacillus endophyticus]